MNDGMMWYDGSPKKTLADKVTEAGTYFHKKYGRVPDLCLMNPLDVEKLPPGTPNQVKVEGRTITISSWKGVLPGHFWLGFENEPVVDKEKPADAFVRHARKVSA